MENDFYETTNPAININAKITTLERILSELARAFEAFAEIFADGDRMFLCFEVTPWKNTFADLTPQSRLHLKG